MIFIIIRQERRLSARFEKGFCVYFMHLKAKNIQIILNYPTTLETLSASILFEIK